MLRDDQFDRTFAGAFLGHILFGVFFQVFGQFGIAQEFDIEVGYS